MTSLEWRSYKQEKTALLLLLNPFHKGLFYFSLPGLLYLFTSLHFAFFEKDRTEMKSPKLFCLPLGSQHWKWWPRADTQFPPLQFLRPDWTKP